MNQEISVLLIEDDPDYVALVRAWLAQNKEIDFTVHRSGTLSAGIARLEEGGIDLVLLDLSLPDSDGPQTFQALQTRAEVPVILLSGNDRESLAFDLVAGGAQDYLVKSRCSAEVLSRSILYSMLRHVPAKDSVNDAHAATVLGLLSSRGGVGVTTFACALASELQRRKGEQVLLVDLDVHTNQIAFLLGIKPAYTLLDALSNVDRLDQKALHSLVSEVESGLHVLASPGLQGMKEPPVDKVQELLSTLRPHYTRIVLDLGRLTEKVASLRNSADRTVLVSSTALASLYETRRAVPALKTTGCTEEELLVVVAELPGNQRLPKDSLPEMVGTRVSLRLPESSSELRSWGRTSGLVSGTGNYAREVSIFADSLVGAAQQEESGKRLVQMLGLG